MKFLALEVTEAKNINHVENNLDPFLGRDTIAMLAKDFYFGGP